MFCAAPALYFCFTAILIRPHGLSGAVGLLLRGGGGGGGRRLAIACMGCGDSGACKVLYRRSSEVDGDDSGESEGESNGFGRPGDPDMCANTPPGCSKILVRVAH